MKDSQILYTWAVIFFATCFLASGGAITAAWVAGIVCWVGGLVTRLQEKKAEKRQQESMNKRG